MGLDIVEVVMRCEELFDVRLEPIRLEQMRTVGDSFDLVCEQLNLPGGAPMRDPIAGAPLPLIAIPTAGWSKDGVWTKLVQICVDQLQVEPDQIKYAASFVDVSAQTRSGTYKPPGKSRFGNSRQRQPSASNLPEALVGDSIA
jgi:hypothetical protein